VFVEPDDYEVALVISGDVRIFLSIDDVVVDLELVAQGNLLRECEGCPENEQD
jgi:hypothetical protein